MIRVSPGNFARKQVNFLSSAFGWHALKSFAIALLKVPIKLYWQQKA